MNSEFPNNYDSLLHDVSIQMASSQLSRRNSRSSKRNSGTPSRRSIRVEKPPTAHNSPRMLERRRTTSSVKQYASLDDHYNAMFGNPEPEERRYANDVDKNSVRPMSWHPSTSTAIQARSRNASSHRHSVDVPDIPAAYISSDIGTKSTLPDGQCYVQDNGSYADGPLPADVGTIDVALWNRYATASSWPLNAPVDPYLAHELTLFANNAHYWASTVPTSPQQTGSLTVQNTAEPHHDFLPIQYPSALQSAAQPTLRTQRSKDSSKSLVGMGLYDSPEPATQSWQADMDGRQSWLAPDLVKSGGKGLKLEETFEPPPDHGMDGEEEDDDDEDNGSSEDEVQEEPPGMDEPHLHVTVASSQPASMAGQSFFFDDDDAYSGDWWYGQTKSVTAPDAAMDYGWI